MKLKAVMGLALLLVAASAEARVYKWVDENGEVHYSEATPPQQKAQEVAPPPTPPQGAGPNSGKPDQLMLEMDAAERKRKAQAEEEQKVLAERRAAERHNKCLRAQENLDLLRQPVPLYTVGTKGDRNYMDDETRAAEVKKMTEQVASYCDAQ